MFLVRSNYDNLPLMNIEIVNLRVYSGKIPRERNIWDIEKGYEGKKTNKRSVLILLRQLTSDYMELIQYVYCEFLEAVNSWNY